MATQTYLLTPARIDKFKGQILKHSVPVEVLARTGRQVDMPQNSSQTIIQRRWLPFGATASNPNQFFQNGAGDRGTNFANQHLTQEGVTPNPDNITPQDVSAVVQQYSILYGVTDKTTDLYEDDIPKAMIEQVGERLGLVNEMIIYGQLRSCTNQFYGGSGTSRSTVNGFLTLQLVRKIVKSLKANHGRTITIVLSASNKIGTESVSSGFLVFCHTDLEPDIRDLPGFTPTERYASGTPMPNEVGKVENLRFITSPDLPSIQDAGAAIGATGGISTSGTYVDVYPFIVTADDAWSQIAIRGKKVLDPTYIKPGEKSKSDPLGQRGYIGVSWWQAALVENNGWMAVGNVAAKAL